jgi:hypothetical protein
MNTDGVSSYSALQVWAAQNIINVYAGNSGFQFGARFESSSHDNVVYLGGIQAGTTVVNLGTNNTFQLLGSGASAGMITPNEVSAATMLSSSLVVDSSWQNDLLLVYAEPAALSLAAGTAGGLATTSSLDRSAIDDGFGAEDFGAFMLGSNWADLASFLDS